MSGPAWTTCSQPAPTAMSDVREADDHADPEQAAADARCRHQATTDLTDAERPGRHAPDGSSVAEGEQQPDDEGVGQQRRAAVADEREGHPGERHEAQVGGHDERRLEHDDERQPGGQQRLELIGCPRRDAQPSLGEDEVAGADRERTQETQLLAQGREGEVGVDQRDGRHAADGRQTGAEAGAQDAATTERVQRPDDLVARAQRVRPGVEPDVDPRPDVTQLAVEQGRAKDEQDETQRRRTSHAGWRCTAGPGRR